ncbi:MAG: hypothetical protein HYY16_09980 [Planctomycetes bacterium]|nr:hypothetical protein [Planctomycetota bacterium]
MKRKLSTAWKVAKTFVVSHRTGLMRAGLGVGAAFIVLLIHRHTYNLLCAQPEYKVKAMASVRVAPAWSGEDSIVEMPADLNLFDEGLVSRIGRVFEGNPWVKRVTAIERIFPDRVRVRLQVRRPHVAVRRAEGLFLLDDDGVVLPGTYPSASACARSVEIVGSASVPPRPGERWESADIRAGVELVEMIARSASLRALDVRAVDVSNVGGRVDRRRPETALLTAVGCTIYWGRAPSSGRFGEPAPEEKLELLAAVVREYPGLQGLSYVKIYAGEKAAVSPAGAGEIRMGKRTRR